MIPKIIHHIWPGDDKFKEKFHDYRIEWMRMHPDWSFMFWRLDNLPPRSLKIVSNLKNFSLFNHTAKSDILRFLILYELGGIYVDTDMQPIYPIDDFLNYNFFCGWEDELTLCPSIIGSIPNHKILDSVVSNVLKSIKRTDVIDCNNNPHIYTGVKIFHDTIMDNQDNDIKLFQPETFYPIHYTDKNLMPEKIRILDTSKSYTIHHWSGMDLDGWVMNKTK